MLDETVAGDYDFGDQLKSVDFKNHRVILLTTHRRENLGEPMRHIYKALRRIIEEIPDTEIVFPVHRNPKSARLSKMNCPASTGSISSIPWNMNLLPTS